MEKVQTALKSALKDKVAIHSNCDCHKKEKSMPMTKKKLTREKVIDSLIASEVYDEEDRDHLEQLEDNVLKRKYLKLVEANKEEAEDKKKKAKKGKKPAKSEGTKNEESEDEEEEDEEEEQVVNKKKGKKPAVNEDEEEDDEKVLTEEQWLAKAPPSVRAMHNFGMSQYRKQRDRYIDVIVSAEVEGGFSKKDLKDLRNEEKYPLSLLQKMANTVIASQEEDEEDEDPRLAGMFLAQAGAPISNGERKIKHLAPPSANADYSKKRKKRQEEDDEDED
jgi:hypothetical protein